MHSVSVQEPHVLREVGVPKASTTWLVGERRHRMYVLSAEKIEYIESHGNYVTLSVEGTQYISRDSVKRLAAALTPCGFIRIHKSLVINIAAVWYLERGEYGVFAFTLHSGARLRSGAAYRREILRTLPLAKAPRLRSGGREMEENPSDT